MLLLGAAKASAACETARHDADERDAGPVSGWVVAHLARRRKILVHAGDGREDRAAAVEAPKPSDAAFLDEPHKESIEWQDT